MFSATSGRVAWTTDLALPESTQTTRGHRRPSSVTSASLSQFENGHSLPAGATLRRLAVALRLKGDVTTLVEIVAALPARQVVITGAAGSGKTSAAVLLALRVAREGETPVLLDLVAWDPDRHRLDDWLATRLTTTTTTRPASLRAENARAVASRLVERGAVIPVLDGLDELPDHLLNHWSSFWLSRMPGSGLIIWSSPPKISTAMMIPRTGLVLSLAVAAHANSRPTACIATPDQNLGTFTNPSLIHPWPCPV